MAIRAILKAIVDGACLLFDDVQRVPVESSTHGKEVLQQ